MKSRKLYLITISLLLLGVALAPSVRADESDKKTVMTFSEPVQVPGVVLPAGTYVFKLADTQGDRNIVQIFNADEDSIVRHDIGDSRLSFDTDRQNHGDIRREAVQPAGSSAELVLPRR